MSFQLNTMALLASESVANAAPYLERESRRVEFFLPLLGGIDQLRAAGVPPTRAAQIVCQTAPPVEFRSNSGQRIRISTSPHRLYGVWLRWKKHGIAALRLHYRTGPRRISEELKHEFLTRAARLNWPNVGLAYRLIQADWRRGIRIRGLPSERLGAKKKTGAGGGDRRRFPVHVRTFRRTLGPEVMRLRQIRLRAFVREVKAMGARFRRLERGLEGGFAA